MPISLSGVLPIDKSPGMTSHDVVAIVRRLLRQGGFGKVKVGHAGTLDPGATGVLLVCVGPATRLADLLADQGKSYRAEFTLGAQTTTEDAFGEVTAECDASHIVLDDIEVGLTALTGTILQTPPMVSAVHYQGKRLYELARAGVTVDREARPVEIKSIELTRFESGIPKPFGEIVVECGKGTYIRTLCADLGAQLGVGGHMSALRRLSVGIFTLDKCIPLESGAADSVPITQSLVSASEAVSFLPLRIINDLERSEIHFGRAIPLGTISGDWENQPFVRLQSEGGELIALGSVDTDSDTLQPKKVLSQGD